jgi:hypothetical protein
MKLLGVNLREQVEIERGSFDLNMP